MLTELKRKFDLRRKNVTLEVYVKKKTILSEISGYSAVSIQRRFIQISTGNKETLDSWPFSIIWTK